MDREQEKKEKQISDQPQDWKEEAKIQEDQQKSSEDEKPFDFGGLPDRDLKKNLGCG